MMSIINSLTDRFHSVTEEKETNEKKFAVSKQKITTKKNPEESLTVKKHILSPRKSGSRSNLIFTFFIYSQGSLENRLVLLPLQWLLRVLQAPNQS
jgi:hypothetical protein